MTGYARRGTGTIPRTVLGRHAAALCATRPARQSRPRRARDPWTHGCSGPLPATLAGECFGHLELGVLPDAVPVGHARQVVRHAPSQVILFVPCAGGRQQLGVLDVVLEQPPQPSRDLRVLSAHGGPEVDT